ncbi:MAG: hypothetical protein K9N47_21765 [Prosthecobacter sp.]|uniref:hypothetical protein n=1 Tax=Prosthecobacter sp. TaxID=1965333 RepID=UPI00260AA4B0|nr:hypothetical protein [Prosthecobacter sp.]MCF7788767.1 hypothetical protein [Prosthecobacter sp.]
MQFFIRAIVLLFIIPVCTLLAGVVIMFVVLPSLGVVETKSGRYIELALLLVMLVGSTWLYVRSWKKPDGQSAPPRSSTSMRSGFILALAMVIGVPFYYLKYKSSREDAALQQRPGHAAFLAANDLVAGSSQGIAHGNSPEAQELAKALSSRLKEAREMGIDSRKSAPIVSLTHGQFLTYCLLTKDSCVFMVHVPELRKYSSEAKDFITKAAWVAALDITQPHQADLRKLAVGLRGVLLYDRVAAAHLNPAEDQPSIKPGYVIGDTECRKFLQGFFTSASAALDVSSTE